MKYIRLRFKSKEILEFSYLLYQGGLLFRIIIKVYDVMFGIKSCLYDGTTTKIFYTFIVVETKEKSL